MGFIAEMIKRLPTYQPFANTYQVRCPDGTIKTVYKNIDDVLPLYIPGWVGKLKTELPDANITAEYATKIHGLLYYIDEHNKNIFISFRIAYLGYKNDPCNNNAYFNRQIEKIIDEQNKIVTFNSRIKLLMQLAVMYQNNPEKFNPLYEQIAEQLIGVNIPEAATSEIAETRTLARDWVDGEHGR